MDGKVDSGIISLNQGGIKGLINRVLAKNIGKVLSIPGGKLYRQYEKATKDVEAVQLNVLKEILSYSKDTEFGKKYDFESINSHEEYVSRMPVMDYEEFRPYIDRHFKGEENILFPGKPLMYTRTSGTTNKPKLIPITEYNFKKTIQNRGKLWLYGLYRQFPDIYDGKDFTLVSPAVDGYSPDNVPYGALSGLVYKNIPEFVNLVHTIPYEVICIKDFNARAYTLLRFGVPSDVTAVFTGNPGTVLNLAIKADEWKELLIKDIFDGTLNKEFCLESEIRAKAEQLLKPAPQRAKELEKIASSKDRLLPKDYWPNIKLVHTWTNGNCALVLPKLRNWYSEEIPILDFGYIASEITAADLIDPLTNGSHLAVLSGFYEFSLFEEGQNPSDFFMAHELEVGRRYYIYITTFSGLYRYNMNDVIEVVGKFGQAPTFKFLFKGNGVTSIQGEKLSEEQLIEAVAKASERTNNEAGFFVGCALLEEDVYKIFIDLRTDRTPQACEKFAHYLDEALSEVNIEYKSKRESQRLKKPEVVLLVNDAFSEFRKLRLEEGAFEGQFKWLHLSANPLIYERMLKLVENIK